MKQNRCSSTYRAQRIDVSDTQAEQCSVLECSSAAQVEMSELHSSRAADTAEQLQHAAGYESTAKT